MNIELGLNLLDVIKMMMQTLISCFLLVVFFMVFKEMVGFAAYIEYNWEKPHFFFLTENSERPITRCTRDLSLIEIRVKPYL